MIKLRDFATGTREAREHFSLVNDVLHNCCGICGRILGDKGSYSFEILVRHDGTKLLGEPFVEAGFYFFLRDWPIYTGVFKSTPNLVKDVKVVLDVLDRGVVRQTIQELLDVMLRRVHLRQHNILPKSCRGKPFPRSSLGVRD